MYTGNYSPKAALQDMLKVIAHRVNSPQTNASTDVPDELTNAECRLHMLSSVELLNVVCTTLSCGITPTISRGGSLIEDPPGHKSPRFMGAT